MSLEEAPVEPTPAHSGSNARINIPILIASLLISLMLWGMVFSQSSNTRVSSIRVRLKTTGLADSKYVLMNRDALGTISVPVLATEDRIRELESMSESENMYGTVQLGAVHEGKLMAPVVLFPTKLREVAVHQLPTVPVIIERLGRKSVPVRITTSGQTLDPEAASLVDTNVDPSRVEVLGPQSQIERVVDAHGNLDLKTVNPNALTAYPVQLFASNGRSELNTDQFRIDPQTAQVTPIFSSEAQQRQVPVSVTTTGSPAKGFGMSIDAVNPPVVNVSGNPALLATLVRLETDPIDVSGMKEDATFTIPIHRPAGVRLVSPSTVRVRVNIRPMAKTGGR